MHRLSTLENKYSNIFFYKTIAPTVLKFYMEHDLPPRSQNYKIGSGRISKMAAITKNSKNNIINFFSRTARYFWLNFGKFHLKYDQTPGFQNYEFGLGQESKMAAVTKNGKIIKINFFSGTIKYNWL